MKTDPSIYEFLATGPEAFRVLSGGLTLPGAYRFVSLTLKGIERRLDGIYEPQGHAGPALVVEFQAQSSPAAWFNLLTKVGLYGEAHPGREVQGILIFLRVADDPGAPPGAAPPLLTAVYLEETLPAWLEREPDNPYVAALVPLIVRRDADLRTRAPAAWRTIQAAPLDTDTRATLERMLRTWLMERLPTLTKEDLRTMFPTLVPLEQSRAYQEIFAEGKARGEAEGKADGLKLQLTRRFGPLPEWAIERIETAAMEQLDAWLLAIFEAKSLRDLIGREPVRPKSKAS